MTIVLASASPRRQELLGRMGLSFTVQAPDIEERRAYGLPPGKLVETLSREKALAVSAGLHPDVLVIAADTVVVSDGRILGKPANPEEAAAMLRSLSGRTHEVFTGLTLAQSGTLVTTHEITSVRFRPLDQDDIRWYVATGEPMDKAGAYGIQGYGAVLVSGLAGDYFNVMGLPVCRLSQLLSSHFGIDVLQLAAQREGIEMQ